MLVVKKLNHLPLNTLSRLKGIETRCASATWCIQDTLNTLSRLKGIETIIKNCANYFEFIFEYTFPFEGN